MVYMPDAAEGFLAGDGHQAAVAIERNGLNEILMMFELIQAPERWVFESANNMILATTSNYASRWAKYHTRLRHISLWKIRNRARFT